ncbi:small ribonucleoprotein particle protein SmE [Ochromonadaceae sp. CCMP2298]|nr:small ribonucleoprotein particle protein SmE [Ochromonadaceae sp. CCMP2298]
MTQAINLIFEFLKNKETIQIWLYENTAMKMEGVIIGFDEYMNVVLDDAVEVNMKTKARKTVGRILLKGDCITLIQRADPSSAPSM